MKQHALTHKNRDMKNSPSSRSNSNPNSDCDQPKTPRRDFDDGSNDNSRPEATAMSLKRSPPDSDGDSLPIAKRLQSKKTKKNIHSRFARTLKIDTSLLNYPLCIASQAQLRPPTCH